MTYSPWLATLAVGALLSSSACTTVHLDSKGDAQDGGTGRAGSSGAGGASGSAGAAGASGSAGAAGASGSAGASGASGSAGAGGGGASGSAGAGGASGSAGAGGSSGGAGGAGGGAGGAGGASGSAGAGGSAPFCDPGAQTDPCQKCMEERCCAELEACAQAAGCTEELVAYQACISQTTGSDADRLHCFGEAGKDHVSLMSATQALVTCIDPSPTGTGVVGLGCYAEGESMTYNLCFGI